jgi:DDE superfamily endonuclease
MYFAEIIRSYDAQKFVRLDIFLDRNTTHKAKMEGLLAELLAADTVKTTIEVRFHLMPAYSPKLNLVEYAIHQIRRQALHHADCKHSLSVFVERVKTLCAQGKVFSQEQIINILGYIGSLVPKVTK